MTENDKARGDGVPGPLLRTATVKDLDGIVRIHEAAFPGFFMTRLGPAFLRRYYDLVLRYPKGILVVADEGMYQTHGFVAGFVDPPQFYATMRASRLGLGIACLPAILRTPSLFPRLIANRNRVEERAGSPVPHVGSVAELASIAVDPVKGRKGFGGQLVAAFVSRAREMGARQVVLLTDALDNQRVNSFYRSMGFDVRRMVVGPGRRQMNEYHLSVGEQDQC